MPLRPTAATVWNGPAPEGVPDLTCEAGLSCLRDAAKREDTVWLGCLFESLSKDKEAWFTGTFDVWSSMKNQVVTWAAMRSVLEALRLPTPTPSQAPREPAQSTFLRAMPYVYSRGVFGTIRDALPNGRAIRKLSRSTPGGELTAFPAVGFQPATGRTELDAHEYLMLRSMVGVVGNVVIAVRLPDRICAPSAQGGSRRSAEEPVHLVLPRRFLPLRAMPSGRELAEAIGIHQATTARGVAEQVRTRLVEDEKEAESLKGRQKGAKRGTDLREKVAAAAGETDRLSEVAQQLNHQIAQILRRMGNRDGETSAAAAALAPPEVERRYRFALEEVRSLYEDCRLASHVVRQAIADNDQRQSQQFQFVAAAVASIVLIPTLIAGIFGANMKIPTEKSEAGFVVLVATIGGLVAISLFALQTASSHEWDAPRKEFAIPIVAAIVIVIAYIVFLVLA